ncbi:HNH endonuclease [Janthinobacterium sp. LB2P49]|uniref:HNH endonuclease n=1 Tax=Janthinobacterium sp. LB2P49 TaxID=3424198 RepID=UPI003F1EBD1D
MPDLSAYTGKPLNEFAKNFFQALKTEGFHVAVTNVGPRSSQRKTMRITWRGVYIAVTNPMLWGRKSRQYCCEYRVPDENSIPRAKLPPDFDLAAFAEQHHCDPNRFYIHDQKKEGRYLRIEDSATALILMRDWKRRIDYELFSPRRVEDDMVEDLLSIMKDSSKSETERLAQLTIRLGQGGFRQALDKEFEEKCAVTGLEVRAALRASHIVPWTSALGSQRIDPKNGLLLSANIDALFDRYMITFGHDGRLKHSHMLTKRDWEMLGPIGDLRAKPCAPRAEYLKKHNVEFEKRECERSLYVNKST